MIKLVIWSFLLALIPLTVGTVRNVMTARAQSLTSPLKVGAGKSS